LGLYEFRNSLHPNKCLNSKATFHDLVKNTIQNYFLNDKEELETNEFDNTIYFNFENDEQSATKLYFSEWLEEESIILHN
jgi:hypothetical protein